VTKIADVRDEDAMRAAVAEGAAELGGLDAALPHLVEHGGSLVDISSAAGITGTPLSTPYTASKRGVVGMSMALANELAAQNIRVNTVHPPAC
jgi:NAD(P)-dependent dehydrogenase (short-subunit alcohol dehydrogenase family)